QQQEFVGIIGGFCEDVFSARIQVGYMLNPDYQGLGYATEALTELLRWLQSTYQVHKAIAYCHHHNLASIRVLEKCGFVVEGRLSQNYRLGSIWIDEVQLGKVLA
ncbi:MAG: GNAT family N-acetyltransferase, partial [Shewanella sp.]